MKKYVVDDAKETGSLIKKRRNRIHLSQAELSAALNVSISSLQSWEVGRRTISSRFIPQLLAALKVSAADLEITEVEIIPDESVWNDPGKTPPPTDEEVLIIAKTENYDAGKLLAVFNPDYGWALTDAEYETFEVKAYMTIPEWDGWHNE